MSDIVIADTVIGMSEKDKKRYKAYHCGLCHSLKEVAGTKGPVLLNDDLTLMYIILSSLYDDVPAAEMHSCRQHPFSKRLAFVSDTARYVAEMNILMSSFVVQCSINTPNANEKRYIHSMKALLDSIIEEYPRQAASCRKSAKQMIGYGRRNEPNTQLVSGCFGEVFGQAFIMREDEYQKDLYDIGFFLGKFIYLITAYSNRSDDIRSGSYNPLILKKDRDPENYCSFMRATLQSLIDEAKKSFERLPLKRDTSIVRNIMDSGVWMRFYSTNEKETGQDKLAHPFFV